MTRERTLVHQLVVRIPPELNDRLLADAEANGRTLAQTVRFHLRRALAVAPEGAEIEARATEGTAP